MASDSDAMFQGCISYTDWTHYKAITLPISGKTGQNAFATK